jgi:hypothetical protein
MATQLMALHASLLAADRSQNLLEVKSPVLPA